jgi:hypothetical protein
VRRGGRSVPIGTRRSKKTPPKAPFPPVVTNPGSISSTVEVPLTLAIAATGATSFTASGFPAGLAFSMTTGVFSGSPSTIANYTTHVIVTGAGGTTTITFTWGVVEQVTPEPESTDGPLAPPSGGILFAEEVYAELEPIAEPDAESNYALRALVRANASMFAQTEEVVRAIGVGLDAWERLFDADRAPVWFLPFVGQAVGVSVDTSRSPAEQRAQIKAEGGWHRGRPAALIAAVRATLTGTKRVRLIERVGTAWQTLVVTFPNETPSEAVTAAAARSQKPGGIVMTVEQSELPLIDEATRTIDGTTATIDRAQLANVT